MQINVLYYAYIFLRQADGNRVVWTIRYSCLIQNNWKFIPYQLCFNWQYLSLHNNTRTLVRVWPSGGEASLAIPMGVRPAVFRA